MPDLSGVVVVNKPSGPTSFDVVRRVKGLFKVKRVGHTGTLDPTATGVLPICVGEATKVAGFIADGEKEYEATVRFGQVTDTQDAAGRVLETRPVEGVTEDRVREALRSFVGLIEQTPPMYSARKVEGKRLYELARYLKPLDRALEGLAELRLDPQLSRRVAHGHTPGPADLSRLRAPPYPRGRRVRLVDPAGHVLAVAESDGVGTLKLLRVLSHGELPPERHYDE